jgi:uncharacterized protein
MFPMQFLPVTSLYVALLALLLCALSVRVLLIRRELKVLIGDGGHARLQRASRVQANFAEYVPMALLLLMLLELRGHSAVVLHAYGSVLLVARAAHAIGVSRVNESVGWRIVGMASTFSLLGLGALVLLAQGVAR